MRQMCMQQSSDFLQVLSASTQVLHLETCTILELLSSLSSDSQLVMLRSMLTGS